jgi:hypothetical protein
MDSKFDDGMRLIILLLFLSIYSLSDSAHAASYERIGDGPKSVVYIDKLSIDREKKGSVFVASVTILINFKSGFPTQSGVARSALVYGFFDCTESRHVITGATYFSGLFSEGVIVYKDREVSNNMVTGLFKKVQNRVCI